MWLLKTALLLCIFYSTEAKRNFFLGHRNGGNVLKIQSKVAPDLRAVETKFFVQKIDHFSHVDHRTFLQKYQVNAEFYNETIKRNTFFLMISGESTADPSWMRYGEWYRLAKKYGAVLFQLEHRYYGTSHPFSNISTANLQYLSSEQAIEDLAAFISAINDVNELSYSDANWIVFGGSYAGSLAAWLRQKYTHLVKGAVSSSGPLLAKYDFFEYYQVVNESLSTMHSQACADNLQVAIKQLDDQFIEKNYTNIGNLFHICGSSIELIDNDKDKSNFFQMIAEMFASVVQYNGMQLHSIRDVCELLVNAYIGDELQRLSAVSKLLYAGACFDAFYNNLVLELRDERADPSNMMRQWIYQTCTEFGFFQTSGTHSRMFGDKFPVEFFGQLCADVFVPEFSETNIMSNIANTNVYYGELEIDVSNVVFVNGKVDPWHALGIYDQDRYPKAPVIFLTNTSHCVNMYEYADSDSEELKNAKNEVDRLIGEWLRKSSVSGATNTLYNLSVMLVCVFAIFV